MPSTASMSSDEEISIRKISQFDEDSASIFDFPPAMKTKSRRTTNTGPKGVRADARAYEASKREANAMKSLKNAGLLNVPPSSSHGESGSDASEDEWMSRWREKRMKELSKTGVAGVNLFGQVDDVDAKGYLAAVDYEDLEATDDNPVAAKRIRAKRNLVTVVLIYDNSIDSKSLFQIFSKLARRHPTVHFLRLSSQYAEELPSTSLPAILAYRRGELIANLVHFVDELLPGEKIDDTAVQDALVREGVLQDEEDRQSEDSL